MRSATTWILSAGLLAAAVACPTPTAWGQPSESERVPEIARPADAKPGEIALLTSAKGMRYFLRVPTTYDPKRPSPLLVFLHGSNMNGLQFLQSFEARRWCQDFVLACPNGETGGQPYGQNNFTFQSAPYIAEITRDLQKTFRPPRSYVGGFSQGGYVTYNVMMLHPDLYQGALPMAGGCWSQNEPNLWETKPDTMAKQKQLAIAIVHGKVDQVVDFEAAEAAFGSFHAMGYPRLRLFSPERVGHNFMGSPVGEAIAWLEVMTGGAEPAERIKAAEKFAKDGDWGWATQIARQLERGKDAKLKKRARRLLKAANAAAKRDAKGMARHWEESPPMTWLPLWYRFWQLHGGAKSAKPLIDHYLKLRTEQRAVGQKLFSEAFQHSRAGRGAERNELLREILAKAPASFEAHYAVRWLTEQGLK